MIKDDAGTFELAKLALPKSSKVKKLATAPEKMHTIRQRKWAKMIMLYTNHKLYRLLTSIKNTDLEK